MGCCCHQHDSDDARYTTGDEHFNRDAQLHDGYIILFILLRILTSVHKHKPDLSRLLFLLYRTIHCNALVNIFILAVLLLPTVRAFGGHDPEALFTPGFQRFMAVFQHLLFCKRRVKFGALRQCNFCFCLQRFQRFLVSSLCNEWIG